MKKKIGSRIAALMLCVLTLIGLLPTAAFAASDTVTIESQKNDAFDYLEYYSNGKWKDLNTPKHWIESTGQVCYCIEHSEGNPHGDEYTAASPSSVFSSGTLKGLQIILMNGYPCNTPSGFTADEARQATANAIRFWLSENGEEGSYSFTNRKKNPNQIRAKSGYTHVLEWADELLQKARDKETFTHSITFTPTALTLTRDGDNFTGSTTVKLVNVNSGYTLDTSGLPSGVTVTGYTGKDKDVLSFTAPKSASGKAFTIAATGKDTRSIDNITAYIPDDGSLQKIFLCATTAKVVATASVGVDTPAYGELIIKKTGTDGAPLSGVKFGVYTDKDCTNQICTMTTGQNGTVSKDDFPAGTVYVKELSTVSPYVLNSDVHTVTITANKTETVTLENVEAKGQIILQKNADQLTATKQYVSDYGYVNTPVFTKVGLKGCVFEILDSGDDVIAELTTDENGHAETGLLPFGTYTVREKASVKGYAKNAKTETVTLAYKDQNTPIVKGTLTLENLRVETSVKLKKMAEEFKASDMQFHDCVGKGFVFGLYTAENIGILPKDTLLEILTTGDDGSVESTVGVPFGNYYLRELASPSASVEVRTESFPLSVSGKNTDYFDDPIVDDAFKGNIAIWKSDGSTYEGPMLAGAVYEVRNSSGALCCTMTTDKDGYAVSCDLPVGSYTVQETVPPAGFVLSDEIIKATISTSNKAAIVFERTNDPNRIVIRKSDLTTGKPVPNCFIKIFDNEGKEVFDGESDMNGEIILGRLPAGDYTYVEYQAPEGFAICEETFRFSIDAYGKVTGDTEIKDEPITLKLTKMNGYTHKPFAGIEFTLLDEKNDPVKTMFTEKGYRVPSADGTETFCVDENGYSEFRYLRAGEYTLVEKTPFGYISADEVKITLTDHISASNPYALTIENCPTGVKLQKVDASTNNPLVGASFRVKVKGDDGFEVISFTKQADGSFFYDPEGTFLDLQVDSNGEILMYGLPLGTVWFEESVTPEGYFPISAQKLEITKSMTSADPYALTIKNSKYVKLGMDSDWWEFPAMILGILLVTGGTVFFIVRRNKRSRKRRA